MSAAHTPGPWEIAGPMAFSGPGCIIASNGVFVAKPLTVNTEANARLIAAAPDLLAALKACETIIDDFVGHLTRAEQNSDPDVGLALSNTRAAIAKAEGRS